MTAKTKEFAATEVLAKADKWVDRRRAVQIAPPDQKAREAGRYEKSGDDLAAAVEQYRKADGRAS